VHTLLLRSQGENKLAEDESVLSRAARAADRVLAYGEDPGQIIEMRDGADGAAGRALVLLVHGGFWRPDIDRVHTRPMAEAIAAAGWSVALPEYARVPGDPAPTLADLTAVLTQAARLAGRHNGSVILIGHSAGGHLALWATAARLCPRLTGTVALAPVADLLLAHEMALGHGAVARFLGGEPVSRPDIDPRQMSSPVTPTTIVHGRDDALVPLAISESYVAAHPSAALLPIAGAGHFALIDPLSAAWPLVVRQLALMP
jgi:acetyl esterase/lipase